MDGKQEPEISRLRFSTANLPLDLNLLNLSLHFKAGFIADQPRVPAGSPDGGQWTDGGSRLLLVSRRGPRGTGQVRINGNWHTATPAQEARLSVSLGQMQAALRAVRKKVDRKWKLTPQAYATIEGYIRANEATALEAQFRIFELRGTAVGPGTYARGWMPAPPTNRRLTRPEQEETNRLGRKFGCHRCGTIAPGIPSGNFVGEHQMPKRLGTPTRIYPHCFLCSLSRSLSQGGLVRYGRY
jgi:hypothetical protein